MTLIQLFSFDVVGSAAFKQCRDAQQGAPSWLQPFHDFFTQTPLLFTAEVAHVFFDEDGDIPEVFVWKAIGDELVFIAYPQHSRELTLLSQAFVQAMRKVDEQFEGVWGLRVHGATWSFEEGERNLSIRFRELETTARHVIDLIGPDVDLGFRLVSHAPAGAVLSPLCHLERLSVQPVPAIQIGAALLKGIQREPYPLMKLVDLMPTSG